MNPYSQTNEQKVREAAFSADAKMFDSATGQPTQVITLKLALIMARQMDESDEECRLLSEQVKSLDAKLAELEQRSGPAERSSVLLEASTAIFTIACRLFAEAGALQPGTYRDQTLAQHKTAGECLAAIRALRNAAPQAVGTQGTPAHPGRTEHPAAAVSEAGKERALLQRWYDLYGGSTLEIRAKYPEDKYAQGEMATLDKDTEQFLGIESQYERSATEGTGNG